MTWEDDVKKTKKRMVLSVNRVKGKMAEDVFAAGRSAQGYEVRRTGRGSDFSERKVNLFTGKKGRRELVEVKSSQTAPLSKLQKKTKKLRVERW